MSLVKYKLKDVAADFGVTPKEIAQIVEQFFEKPKSNTQVLSDDELNVVFDQVTKSHQIESLEVVFAVQPKPKAEEKKEEAPKAEAPKAEGTAPEAPKAQPKPEKPKEPERKRERRVVDTSAVQVNSARFDDRVDNLVSERVQNYAGGKQRIGGGKGKQQQNRRDNKYKGNKARNEEQEKMRRLQLSLIHI